MHGRERRVSPGAARRHGRRPRRARGAARRRIDRPQRRRRAASVLDRGQHPPVHRIDPRDRAVSATRSAPRSISIRTATVPALVRGERGRHSARAWRCNAELGVDVAWLDAAEAAHLAPGLRTDGVLAATFCARDGIADPNGVTMGFAKAAQAMGVRIERETEVDGDSRRPGRASRPSKPRAGSSRRGSSSTRPVRTRG